MSRPAQDPTRREVLAQALGGFAGLAYRQGALGPLFAQASRASARACIVLWMEGGPSQIDTFDPKPGRATGGEFGVVRTNVPGMEISGQLPRLAQLGDSFSLIRSMTSSQVEHAQATYLLRTGYDIGEGRPHPSLGSLFVHETQSAAALGAYVRISCGPRAPGTRDLGARAGLLGSAYQPFEIEDALHPLRGLPLRSGGSARRASLAEDLDRTFTEQHPEGSVKERSVQRSAALRLEDSELGEALSFEREREDLRASYGVGLPGEGSAFGAGCLLARRLIERGTRFVEVALGGWDTHVDNFKTLRPLLGALDRGYSGLLRDLRDRGLLSSTLVVWMGEFGRTPEINAQKGRDHYGRAFSVAVAGGGIQGGRIVGKTDPDGREILEDPVTVPDLFATLLAAAGADPARKVQDPEGDILRLTNHGKVVKRLFE